MEDKNTDIFEAYKNTETGPNKQGKDLKGMIKVVPSTLWVIFVAASVVIFFVLIWITVGWSTTTVTMTGIYHPGASEYGEVLCFPNVTVAKNITVGMPVTVNATDGSGYIEGVVSYTDDYVTSLNVLNELLGDASLVNAFYQSAPVVLIVCKLDEDPNEKCGYDWVGSRGKNPDKIADGTFFSVSVATGKTRPILDNFFE